MEFNGLLAGDFDFFKKKEKMSKEEYERLRNEVKVHFRGLCYEIQKIYHKNTNGVFEIEKDFQNFNKRSDNICARHITPSNNIKINIEMNSDNVFIDMVLHSSNEDEANQIINILQNRKNEIWNYVMGDKHMQIYAEIVGKDKKSNLYKLASLDMNAKNYDSFIGFIDENRNRGKYTFKAGIGYCFPKNECIKQGKNFVNIVYTGIMNILGLANGIR